MFSIERNLNSFHFHSLFLLPKNWLGFLFPSLPNNNAAFGLELKVNSYEPFEKQNTNALLFQWRIYCFVKKICKLMLKAKTNPSLACFE